MVTVIVCDLRCKVRLFDLILNTSGSGTWHSQDGDLPPPVAGGDGHIGAVLLQRLPLGGQKEGDDAQRCGVPAALYAALPAQGLSPDAALRHPVERAKRESPGRLSPRPCPKRSGGAEKNAAGTPGSGLGQTPGRSPVELVHLLQNADDGQNRRGAATVSARDERRTGTTCPHATLATRACLDELMQPIPKEPCCAALLRHGQKRGCPDRGKMVTINRLEQSWPTGAEPDLIKNGESPRMEAVQNRVENP